VFRYSADEVSSSSVVCPWWFGV